MRNRRNVLGVMVDAVDLSQAAADVLAAARDRRAFGVSALAVHGLMTAVRDPALQYRLNQLELVVPDGQPVVWALNWLYRAGLVEKVAGPDLMAEICRRAGDERLGIYLYGSTSHTLNLLRRRLTRRFPGLRVVGWHPSRFRLATEAERRADLRRIEESGASIVFVGLGCPRQEIWTYENRRELSRPVLAVGAAFDYHAGKLSRSPRWMQRRGLEWLYRLRLEPRRLWRRYVLLNPAYLSLLAVQATNPHRFLPERGKPPDRLLRPS